MTRAPRLKQLAEEINKIFAGTYRATVEKSWSDTDRKVGRLRHPGKGRHGNKLIVYAVGVKTRGGFDAIAYSHDSSQTYRHNGEVVTWIESEMRRLFHTDAFKLRRSDGSYLFLCSICGEYPSAEHSKVHKGRRS